MKRYRHRLIIVCALAALPGAALADRHCLPTLDYYYYGRSAALDQEAPCASALDSALADLAEAGSQALLCGCASLDSQIRSRITALRVERDAASCEDARAAFLAIDAWLKDAVAACQ